MKINKYIDHTLLKADATKEDIIRICNEAKEYDFASVCVNSYWVSLVKEELKVSNVKVTSVVGFPLGAMSSKAKVCETLLAIQDGADEIDMVINIGKAKEGDFKEVQKDILLVRKACEGKILKVIIECCLLTDEEKIKVCEVAKDAHADYVKTSTGFSTGGAKASDVALMKKTVGDSLKIKASGGIHSLAELREMVLAGASRIGASAGVAIMEDARVKGIEEI